MKHWALFRDLPKESLPIPSAVMAYILYTTIWKALLTADDVLKINPLIFYVQT